jgi:hypothetical protein
MPRVKEITIYIPYETYTEYRDIVMRDLGKREYMSTANNYASNDSVAESLLANAILPYLGEELHDNPNVEPTEEGTLEEIAQPRDDDGNFTSNN